MREGLELEFLKRDFLSIFPTEPKTSQLLLTTSFCKRIFFFFPSPFALLLRIWVQLYSGVLVPNLSWAGTQGPVSHPNTDVESKAPWLPTSAKAYTFPPLSLHHPPCRAAEGSTPTCHPDFGCFFICFWFLGISLLSWKLSCIFERM